MKPLHFTKNKVRLIYASPFTYWMLSLQAAFLVLALYACQITQVSGYLDLLRKDLFLWMICIPILVAQHKASVFATYYSCIARIGGKRRMMLVDYLTLAVSTGISVCAVLSVPMVFLLAKGGAPVSQETAAAFFFLLLRYLLLGLLVQYILYAMLYAFPNLQKKGGSICGLPFLLYFVLTAPMEFLRTKGLHVLLLDFSAGGNSVLPRGGVVLWNRVFLYNIHLAGYLALCVWMTIGWVSKRWEFLENESVSTL